MASPDMSQRTTRTNKQNASTKLPLLHEKLEKYMLIRLKRIFEQKGCLEQGDLRKVLFQIAGLKYSDEEFKVLFMKIDSARTGCVTWSELLSHVILGYQEAQDTDKEELSGSSLELPITGHPRIVKSRHRHPINRITFYPEVTYTRTVNYLYGSYITCSKDGVINYWSVDMKLQKTVMSTCPLLKVQPTLINDLIAMPDVGVICTASAERDLRFYDTTAQKFELRLMITSLPDAVSAMYYCFYKELDKKCKLILGDMSGRVRMIEFYPKDRGPFQSKLGVPLISSMWDQFVKGSIPTMEIREFPNAHTEWVLQVAFYEKIGFLISVAPCTKNSMILHNLNDKESSYIFKIPKGFWCMAYEEQGGHLIATGGPDGIVRVWNPFVTKRAVAVFRGHHAGIISLILQSEGRILCSISQDRCVKIWDVVNQDCIQSYKCIPPSVGDTLRFATFYNPSSRQVFLAGLQVAIFSIYPTLNGDYTDGFTHSKDISVVLFNELFKIVVTCGFDSFIIVWDPFTGRRNKIVREAHHQNIDGVLTPIAITAACFDPSNQQLISGAEDGTLKVWNFNTGTCIRNMTIGNHVVHSIFWMKLRILVMGENRVVTEFTDSTDVGASNSKSWVSRHTHDILASDARLPQTLVTGSYNGELILWRLETGQAYGMYNVEFPNDRITMKYTIKERKDLDSKSSSKSLTKLVNQSYSGFLLQKKHGKGNLKKGVRSKTRLYSVATSEPCSFPTYAIQSILFLKTRPMQSNVATLLVAVATGEIQLWSHASGGGYMYSFYPCHTNKDYVNAMATDKDNEILITGHYAGYIKIWLLKNFGWPKGKEFDISMPRLRLTFPFMWGDTLTGRAQRARKGKGLPLLLSSYQGHYQPVTNLAYIDENQIILSCSADCTARLWTIGGRYLCTLGTFKPFEPIDPNGPVPNTRECPLPADIRRFCSSTTLRVLSGGCIEKPLTKKQKARRERAQPKVIKGVYGSRVPLTQILGSHFTLPPRCKQPEDIKLDTTLRQIPIYKEFVLHEAKYLTDVATPEKIRKEARLFKRRQSPPKRSKTEYEIKKNG